MKELLYHDIMTRSEKLEIDRIYEAVKRHCFKENIKIAYDDRAEMFVEAIAKYITESKEA